MRARGSRPDAGPGFSRNSKRGLPGPLTPLPTKAITRSFESLSDAVAWSRDARVHPGIHFQEGCKAGARQGKRIGRFLVRHELESTRNCRKHKH